MEGKILTGRDSLSLALGLSGGTPVPHRWKTHTHSQTRRLTCFNLLNCYILFTCI